MHLFLSIKTLRKIINITASRLNRKKKAKKDGEDYLVLKNKKLNDVKHVIITIMEDHAGLQHKEKSEISLKNIPEYQLKLILVGLKFLNEPNDSLHKVKLKKIESVH